MCPTETAKWQEFCKKVWVSNKPTQEPTWRKNDQLKRILIVRSWLPTPPGFDRFTENSQILTVKGNDTSFFGGTLPSPVAPPPPPPPKKKNK